MTAVDIALFATVVGSIVLFGGAAVLALGWAFRAGQFDNFDQGAKSIFGPDEPIGEATDAFPGTRSEQEPQPVGEAESPSSARRAGTA